MKTIVLIAVVLEVLLAIGLMAGGVSRIIGEWLGGEEDDGVESDDGDGREG